MGFDMEARDQLYEERQKNNEDNFRLVREDINKLTELVKRWSTEQGELLGKVSDKAKLTEYKLERLKEETLERLDKLEASESVNTKFREKSITTMNIIKFIIFFFGATNVSGVIAGLYFLNKILQSL